MYKSPLLLIGWLLTANNLWFTGTLAEPATNTLADNEVFSVGYPKTIFYRGETSIAGRFRNRNAGFAEMMNHFNGVMMKTCPEEIAKPEVAARVSELLQQYHEAHPRQLVGGHLSARSFLVEHVPQLTAHYMRPGHWLTKPAIAVKSAIPTGKNDPVTIELAEVEKLEHQGRPNMVKSDWVPALLVTKTADQFDISSAEYVELKIAPGQMTASNPVGLRRGYLPEAADLRTEFPAHAAGTSWVVPIVYLSGTKDIADNRAWMVDVSIDGWVDDRGWNGAEALAQFIAGEFQPADSNSGRGGGMTGFDGISLDVLSVVPSQAGRVDSDWNGILDDEQDIWHRDWKSGVYQFITRLRELMGQQKLITTDGNKLKFTSLSSHLNGIESESLTLTSDPEAKSWSTAVNAFIAEDPLKQPHPAVNLQVIKFNGFDLEPAWMRQLYRFGNASATILGSTVAVIPQNTVRVGKDRLMQPKTELYPPGLGKNWLGQPTSEVIRPVFQQTNIWSNSEGRLPTDFRNRIEVLNDDYTTVIADHTLSIEPKAGHAKGPSVEVLLKDLSWPKGDAVLRFEARLGGSKMMPGEPQYLTMYVKDHPDEKKKNELAKVPVYGRVTTTADQWSEVSLYIRGGIGAVVQAADSRERVTISLKTDPGEGAALVLRNFSLHAGEDIILRDFENGVVISNPADHEVELDLSTWITAGNLHYLPPNPDDPMVEDTGKLVPIEKLKVPARTGVFLVRQ